jgi:phosphopantetheinyl transferase
LDAENASGSVRREPAAIAVEDGGRPFFVDRHADFNISHSRHVAALAWSGRIGAVSGLPLRVGCDVQYVSPGKSREAVARKYYSPGEKRYIAAAGDAAERLERFYRIWVLKECYLKARGLSVLDMRTSPAFAIQEGRQEGLVKSADASFSFFLYELSSNTVDHYLLALCRETEPPDAVPVPEIRPYSPALTLRRIAATD